MAVPYEESGQRRQKLRTRDALVAATRSLLSAGVTPTVEEAAEAAGISRTTAYRYFPSQRALVVAAHPQIEVESLLPPDAPDDVAARLELVMDGFLAVTLDWESQLRSSLRLALEPSRPGEPGPVLRQGRAIGWIEDALSPLRTRGVDVHRLAIAIRSATGIEALVWLTDVAGLSRVDAAEVMRSNARAILAAALP